MNRQSRLAVAREWLKANAGKNLVKRYAKWYGVDKLCAIVELGMLGVEINQRYKEEVKRSYEALAEIRKQKKKQKEEAVESIQPDGWKDEHHAFIVGYTSGGFAFGITHEEWEQIKREQKEDDPKTLLTFRKRKLS